MDSLLVLIICNGSRNYLYDSVMLPWLWKTMYFGKRKEGGWGGGGCGWFRRIWKEYPLFSHSSPLLSSILPSQSYFANKNGWTWPVHRSFFFDNSTVHSLRSHARANWNARKKETNFSFSPLDCKTVGFFLKISKEIGKAWRKSGAREAREPHTPACEAREKNRIF